ncbi:acyl-CoA dehydrogenase [Achromobacter sp.]|uniref:acyl-CoA dehydrogenase n=1 Tax=Achromobacter sp. TaxID=134375 RepID=UPI00289AE0DB|nr:acyl-CoA dehydrogenase [Achromobacter sp.]
MQHARIIMTEKPDPSPQRHCEFQRLTEVLSDAHAPLDPGRWLRVLVEQGCDQLPLPASGRTLDRWCALATVAAADLSLVKLYEGHTDALAIMAELHAPAPPANSRWAVWCAEPPDHRVHITPQPDGTAVLQGVKAWCSGATAVTHALVSGWNPEGEACLAAVAMDQDGVQVTDAGWHAVGMRASGSVDVVFRDVSCALVGAPGAYVHRPGFLHGGAGIAACWYGGLLHIAQTLRRALPVKAADPHRLAHLGAVDVALAQARAVLRETAAEIDARPLDACALACGRARLAVEAAASVVVERASRALGAGPLCRDADFAQVMADLPVFIRQSHAERDQAAHGQAVLSDEGVRWAL